MNTATSALELPEGLSGSELLRSIVSVSSDCIKILDLNGNILFMNQTGLTALEVSSLDSVLGKSFPEFFEDRQREDAIAAIREAIAGKESIFKAYVRTESKNPTWWDEAVSPLRDTDGKVRWLLVLSRPRTEYKQIQERYRLAALATRQGVYDMDLTTDQIWWSEAAQRLLGYPDMTSTSLTWWEQRVMPEDQERVTRSLTEAITGTAAEWIEEYRFRMANGQVADILERAFIIRSADGKAVRLVGAMIDQTDQKNADAQIRILVERLSGVLESTADGVTVIDHDWRITYANKHAEQQLGNRALLGKNIWNVLPNLRGSKLGEACLTAMNENIPVEIEEFSPTLQRWFECRSYPSGSGITVFFRDVTDQHLAAQRLKETTDRFLLAQEAGKIGTWEWDIATGAEIWSDYMYVLFRVEPGSQVTHATFLNAIHPDDRALLLAKAKALLQGDRQYDTQFRIVLPDGTIRWLAARGEVIRDANGTPIRMYGVNFDVTDIRRVTEELAAAKSAAESANQAKTEFLARMSHEIRTPLNGVMGSADLLLDDEGLTPEQRRHAERIQIAGSALLTVVDDILDFSKIEAGEVELEAKPFAVSELVDSAVSIVKGLAEQKGLALAVDIDPAIPGKLVGDEDRLRQVLLNLMNNAIKFTPWGHVDLKVWAEAPNDGHCQIYFSVRDTGIGIAPEKQDRLFRHFSQVDGSDRRRFGGTGLGLAISKRLIELMGGRINVKSELGQGSTFWFDVTLPISDHEARGSSPAERPAVSDRALRVLLVEDNDLNQEIALAMFKGTPHHVDLAKDGAEAIAAAQANDYDVILMDVQMPVMDGLDATRHIRQFPGPKGSTPIIAMTANVLPQHIEAVKAAGMNDLLGKPFKREGFLAIIDKWAPPASREAAH